VVVPQKLVQEIDGLIADVPLVFYRQSNGNGRRIVLLTGRDEAGPWFAWVSAKEIIELCIQVDIVSLQAGVS
jgi:hypothetical protein